MSDTTITPSQIIERAQKLLEVEVPRYQRLWAYCRNTLRFVGESAVNASDRPYRQAQEWGLPKRITGGWSDQIARKEVVIENDINWRVETMIDYLFGRPLVIESAASDPDRRALIGELLRHVLAANGGILLLQQMALLGSVYGFVDVLVKLDPAPSEPICGTRELGQPPACNDGRSSHAFEEQAGSAPGSDKGGSDPDDDHPNHTTGGVDNDARRTSIERLARMVRVEVVEAARVLPFLSESDWREVVAYGQCWETGKVSSLVRDAASGRKRGLIERFRRVVLPKRCEEKPLVIELITPDKWFRYEDEKLVARGDNSLGRIPLVHVQNTAVPFEYSGTSDVEPLIPLQDELNTRLSDRAHRITMQSFKMYLGKSIENFNSMPVGPGQMWSTDDDKAEVLEFGGDSACPSEDAHISDIREAMDKTSGVTPIAAGAIKGRIGRLTSAAALRVTLQALLAKTEKKRTTYGTAIAQICELSLAWLDRAGLFATTPDERRVQLSWASPIPENAMEKLAEAEAKVRVGVEKQIVLRELGY